MSVQTRFDTLLNGAITDVQTTCVLDAAPAFSTGFGTVERGTASEEDIYWANVAGLQLTGMLRGLSKTALTVTEVAGNKKPHLDNKQFEGTLLHYIINNKADLDENEAISGTWTFNTALPTSTQTPTANAQLTTKVYVDTKLDKGGGTMTGAIDMGAQKITSTYVPVNGPDITNKTYVDSVAAAGPNASTVVAGKVEIATNAEMGAGTAAGGTGALLVPPNSQLVKTSSGAGDENKLAVLNPVGQFAVGFIPPDTDSTKIAKNYLDAKGDLITATADNTPAILSVGANETVLVADSAQAKGVKWGVAPLVGANFKNGVDNAKTATIAHGLGKIPAKVKISAFNAVAGGCSIGVYNGTTTSQAGMTANGAGVNSNSSSTYIIQLYNSGVQNVGITATVTLDATNIYLTWGTIGGGYAGSPDLMWEVEG